MLPLQYQVHAVESVKSTNTTLKTLAKDGAPEGYVLVAASQTNGRGRLNRVFFSPKGTGLYVSVLLRPQMMLPAYALTCMAAVALSETVESFDVRCGIKWVNDLYIDGKKAAGILTESAMNQDGSFQYAVIGIGVNLFSPTEGFPPGIRDQATSVFEDQQDDALKKQFLRRLLQRLKKYYEQLPEITFYEGYRDRLIGIGSRVMITEPDGVQYGYSEGIDRNFRLCVRCDDGTKTAVDRGDVIFQ